MAYERILTIQDISCVGQCSLTVALPILSACGHETAILPSAVLSTHTGGFTGYTFRDLTEDMPAIQAHWEKENLQFAALYTGYLGSEHQIDYVKAIAESRLLRLSLSIRLWRITANSIRALTKTSLKPWRGWLSARTSFCPTSPRLA